MDMSDVNMKFEATSIEINFMVSLTYKLPISIRNSMHILYATTCLVGTGAGSA